MEVRNRMNKDKFKEVMKQVEFEQTTINAIKYNLTCSPFENIHILSPLNNV